jgi:hypothetical protein
MYFNFENINETATQRNRLLKKDGTKAMMVTYSMK